MQIPSNSSVDQVNTAMIAPRVSVVIPSFNHERFIGSAIESVLSQEYSDYELLVADDCSSDNSLVRIQSYAGDSRLKVFRLERNLGACECLNFLIGKASGEYLAVLNSDDLWLPHKLGMQVAFLDSNPHYAACFSWADLVDERGIQYRESADIPLDIFKQSNVDRFHWIRRLFYNGNSLCHPSLLIRKRIYSELGGYNPAFRQLPDFDFWLRLLRQNSIYVLQEVLVYHRRLSGAVLNTSAATIENISRDRNEFAWIVGSLFDSLDDAVFADVFRGDFRRGDARYGIEIACEKYFVLLSNTISGNCMRHLAIDHYIKCSALPGFSAAMFELYSYPPAAFYAVSTGFDEQTSLQIASLERDLVCSREYLNCALEAFAFQSRLLAHLIRVCNLLIRVVARVISFNI